jgi:hypothetical protein
MKNTRPIPLSRTEAEAGRFPPVSPPVEFVSPDGTPENPVTYLIETYDRAGGVVYGREYSFGYSGEMLRKLPANQMPASVLALVKARTLSSGAKRSAA